MKKKAKLLIILLFILLLTGGGIAYISRILKENTLEENIASESENIEESELTLGSIGYVFEDESNSLRNGGGTLSQSGIINEYLRYIKRVSGEDFKREDLPISYMQNGYPISYPLILVPQKYIDKALNDSVFNPKDYVAKEKFKTEKSEWEIYDYSNLKFTETYSLYYDPENFPVRNTYKALAINKKEKKFINFSEDILVENEKEFYKEVIRTFERSLSYAKKELQEMNIETAEKGDLGYEIQFGFNNLRCRYCNLTYWGIGVVENGIWKIDHSGNKSYKEFILNLKPDSIEGKRRKSEILNFIDSY